MLTVHATRTEFNTQPCTTAVLPVGAVEQHGKHLPFGTDLMLANALAKPIAEKLDAYLLPPIAISASMEHRKARGTVYLRPETLALVIRDIAHSLHGSGFQRLVVVNFHGGNWILKPTIRSLNRDLPGFRVVLLQPDLPAAEAEKIFEHTSGDVHGGEYETSLMLHLFPDEVRKVPSGGARSFPPQAFLDYFDTTELTEDGYWGWPEAATAQKGQRAFEALVASSLRFVEQIQEMERKLSGPRAGSDEVALRILRARDIPFAHTLRQIAGWNQTEHDWRGYLSYDPEGCFVAEVRGEPAGTATTIHYDKRFGWIGMVLVHPDFRRLGLGTQLLKRAIQRLQQCAVRCIKLDATPMGRKVYVPLGFVDEYELSRYEGTPAQIAQQAGPDVVAFSTVNFAAAVELDAAAFGAGRAAVIQSLSSRNPDLCFAVADSTGVAGFVIAREGASAVQIGPWIARDAAVAERLLQAVFQRVSGRRVFVDVVAPNEPANALMRKHGFTVQRTLTRMFLGENAHPGNPRLVFGISSPEKG
jgi:creatinine amidohydrolase